MSSKGFWNMLLSVVDPEMERFTERIAAAIPENSPLRSEIVGRIFAVVKAWVESVGERIPGMGGVLLEKSTDYGDFLVANLTKGSGKKARSTRDWMDGFLTDAAERLKRAPTAEAARAETEKIKAEFELRRGLVEMVDQARREATPAAKTEAVSIDWAAMKQKFETAIGVAATEVKRIAAEADAKLGPVADWLESQRGGK